MPQRSAGALPALRAGRVPAPEVLQGQQQQQQEQRQQASPGHATTMAEQRSRDNELKYYQTKALLAQQVVAEARGQRIPAQQQGRASPFAQRGASNTAAGPGSQQGSSSRPRVSTILAASKQPGADRLHGGLLLSSREAEADRALLQQHSVTHVLQVRAHGSILAFPLSPAQLPTADDCLQGRLVGADSTTLRAVRGLLATGHSGIPST